MVKNLKLAICGSVDSGKSSLIGVLTSGKLDDGRGLARSNILRTKHEKESGRTSNISFNYIKYESRDVTLIDLAGHEKYLKTTLYGITGLFIDYGIVVIGSNMGVSKMTKEHLGILLYLKVPIIVILTKDDICPPDIYENTRQRIKKILKLPLFGKSPLFLDTEEDFTQFEKLCETPENINSLIPIITTSCKTGKNINRLNHLFQILPNVEQKAMPEISAVSPIPSSGTTPSSYLEAVYNVKGVGTVITGTHIGKEPMVVGQNLFLGPFGTTSPYFVPIKIRSMHDNYRNLTNQTNPGENYCISIKFLKEQFEKNKLRKGLVLTSNQSIVSNVSLKFKAKIKILNYKTTIKAGYSPVIHCRTIRQAAKIVQILNTNSTVRGGDETEVIFEFIYYPEYIEIGAPIFFRDGTTKGVGEILGII
jgi:translation elongation factor EF-Tu-like GTPase